MGVDGIGDIGLENGVVNFRALALNVGELDLDGVVHDFLHLAVIQIGA